MTERDWIIAPPPAKSTAAEIVRAVAKAHQISPQEITGPSRKRYIVDARQDVAVTLREMGWSMPRIARVFNQKCHTSVLNLLRRSKRETAQ